MSKHVFKNHGINFGYLLDSSIVDKKGNWLSTFLNRLKEQSKDQTAKMRVHFADYKDYTDNETDPLYFGMGVEWFASVFLEHYGHEFNLEGLAMTDDVGSQAMDLGTDGLAKSVRKQTMRKTNRIAQKGSPVYIQVKGTTNKTKIHIANDGSRITNFLTNAMSHAMVSGYPFQARYILFTTASGIHYRLDQMSHGFLEVIDYDKINKMIRGDIVFLNKLREDVGLPLLPMNASTPDQEFLMIRDEIKREEDADAAA